MNIDDRAVDVADCSQTIYPGILLVFATSEISLSSSFLAYRLQQLYDCFVFHVGLNTLASSDPGRFKPPHLKQLQRQLRLAAPMLDLFLNGLAPDAKGPASTQPGSSHLATLLAIPSVQTQLPEWILLGGSHGARFCRDLALQLQLSYAALYSGHRLAAGIDFLQTCALSQCNLSFD